MSKRKLESETASPVKKRKYFSKFQNSWTRDFQGIGKSSKGEAYAFCILCDTHISVAHGGKNDLSRHVSRASHITIAKSVSVKPVTSYFKQDNTVDKVVKAEVIFAYLLAEHNIPLVFADHFTRVIKNMFEDSETAKKFASRI